MRRKQRKPKKKEKPGSGSCSIFFGGAMFGIGGLMMVLRPMPYFTADTSGKTGYSSAVYTGDVVVGMGVFLLMISLALFYLTYRVHKD